MAHKINMGQDEERDELKWIKMAYKNKTRAKMRSETSGSGTSWLMKNKHGPRSGPR